MTGEEKKKHDPIFAACFVVFIIAAVGVLGVYVNDHYLTEDNTRVAYGDRVTVNYTGTFYDYIGSDVAVVFDTTYSSVADNNTVSNSFSKTSFRPTSAFTVGNGTYLQAFEEAIVGHKVGDRVQVTIENAYPAPESSIHNGVSTSGLTLEVVQRMSSAQFNSLYSDYDLSSGSQVTFKTVYGWMATAYLDSSTRQVVVTNMPEVGTEYTYTNGDESDFGQVYFNVTGINGGEITYNLRIDGATTVSGDEIQMIEVDFGSETWYITNYSGGQFSYKTCAETNNETLYFEIEIVSIS